MNWFSLPATQTAKAAEFHDAKSAAKWLAAQPQANVPAMLSSFITQIEAFSRYAVSPRERFKTMELLRKTAFAISNDCRRRFENKPLPLSAAEQSLVDSVRRLWRSFAVAYEHCLQACLDGDASLSGHGARMAQRALICLRVEQLNCYAAGVVPGNGFWANVHSVFRAAEQLGACEELIEDRLLGETSESSVTGQYSMALMLHLVRPCSMSSGQVAAVLRWLARWREQAVVLAEPDVDAKALCLSLDLSEDSPIHLASRPGELPRWLSIGNILRKMRRRVESLAAGESPEKLKLGTGLSAGACQELLASVRNNLQQPQAVPSAISDGMPVVPVGAGLVNIYRLLGGTGLEDELLPASSTDSHLSKEQLAVFGHVVREELPPPEAQLEKWRLAGQERGQLLLLRDAAAGEARLTLRSLLAIQQRERYRLAMVVGLQQMDKGLVGCTLDLLSSDVAPHVAEIRDRLTGAKSKHPAFLLGAENDRAAGRLLLPAGVMARASTIRILDASGQALPEMRLVECVERGGDVDFWRIEVGR